MAFSKETVKAVSNLARIRLNDQELDKLSAQLNDIVSFIDMLKKVDVSSIEPTSHILPVNNVLRQDAPSGSLPLEETLKNAPQKEGAFFCVPKVIE